MENLSSEGSYHSSTLMTADLLRSMKFNAYLISPGTHGVCSAAELNFFVASVVIILELLMMIILHLTLWYQMDRIHPQAMKFPNAENMISKFVVYSHCPPKNLGFQF